MWIDLRPKPIQAKGGLCLMKQWQGGEPTRKERDYQAFWNACRRQEERGLTEPRKIIDAIIKEQHSRPWGVVMALVFVLMLGMIGLGLIGAYEVGHALSLW